MEAIISDMHGRISGNVGCNGDHPCSGASTTDPMLAGSDLGTPGLSRSPMAVSLSGLVDTSEFRTQIPEPTYHTLNGRMSPNSCVNLTTAQGFASVTYATLTPLQPLPPISTVTPLDKYTALSAAPNLGISHNNIGGGGFAFVQQSGLHNFSISPTTGYGLNVKYEYDIKPAMVASPSTQYAVPMVMQAPQPATQLQQPSTVFASYGYGVPSMQTATVDLRPPKQEPKSFSNGFDNYSVSGVMTPIADHSGAETGSPLVGGTPVNRLNQQHNAHMGNAASQPSQQHHESQRQGLIRENKSHSKSHNHHHSQNAQQSNASNGGNGQQAANEMDELNTKELAQRISAELKRYSIPQAIFAQRVLCRSQGTLSDLLRNPKPWSKLKSGRETFRRMWKWLQEPEFQRMSALRLAGTGGT